MKSHDCPHCGIFARNFYLVTLNGQGISVCGPCAHKINPPIESANSTCRMVGHEWIDTTAPNFRKCGRSKCIAAERLVDGSWQAVESRQKKTSSVVVRYEHLGDGAPIVLGRKVSEGLYIDGQKAESDLLNYWR